MLKIAVNGAQGRVGQCLLKALASDLDVACAAAIVRQPSTEQETTIPSLEAVYRDSIDCLIDFSTPSATIELLDFCLKNKIPLVIGTTGFSNTEKEKIQQAAKQVPIIQAPNMSIGINLLYKLSEISSVVLKEKAETGIVDIHHKHKKDAPSGTALKLKDVIEKSEKENTASTKVENAKNIPQIASLRIGNTLGEHQVLFTMMDEEVCLTHKTLDRMVYAKGALLAAKWLVKQKPGMYDMHDVLNLNWMMKKESHV